MTTRRTRHKTVRGSDGISRCSLCGAAAVREGALLLLSCTAEAEEGLEPESPAFVIRDEAEPVLPPVGTLWYPRKAAEPLIFVQFAEGHFNWWGMRTQRERAGQMVFPGEGVSPDVRITRAKSHLFGEMLDALPEGAAPEAIYRETCQSLHEVLQMEKRYPVSPVEITLERVPGRVEYEVGTSVASVLLPDDMQDLIIPFPGTGAERPRLPPAPR